MSSRRFSSLTARGKAIKQYALSLGFSAVGFAKAGRVSPEAEARLRQWLAEGGNADMHYMESWLDKRLDPRLLMPGLKTIVSVALNYAPARRLPVGEPQISDYALGRDYHDVVKGMLRQLAQFVASPLNPLSKGEGNDYCQGNGVTESTSSAKHIDPSPLERGLRGEARGEAQVAVRIFCDTGPVLERYWAVQAGLGWIGRNHQLIIPFAGSKFFLGELFLDFELPYDHPMPDRCGRCHKCIDACPTGALGVEAGGEAGASFFDASLCLSYQTIENRGELSEAAKAAMGDTFYGCDRCQAACPWNRFAKPNTTPELQPGDELLHMTRDKWKHLTVDDYRRLFKGSAVKRAKYDGLMRNIRNLKDD